MKTSKKKSTKQLTAEEIFYFGLGLASLAKDQIDTITSALMKEGKLLAKDKEKFKKNLETKGQRFYKKLQQKIEKTTIAALKEMKVSSRKEFKTLKRQVARKRSTK
jgi:polyhydroxyalkanoate synthesis regulator phasin